MFLFDYDIYYPVILNFQMIGISIFLFIELKTKTSHNDYLLDLLLHKKYLYDTHQLCIHL